MHAMYHQRADIFVMLLGQCWWSPHNSWKTNMEKAMQDAYDMGNKEIILLMREYIENEEVKVEKAKNEKTKRKWWKL